MPKRCTRQKKRHRGYRQFFTRPRKGGRRPRKMTHTKESCVSEGPETGTTHAEVESSPECGDCFKLPSEQATVECVTDRGSSHELFQHQQHLPAEVDHNGSFLGFDIPAPGLHGERMLQKHGIRVLALFDGLATGLVALEKLGIQVDAYFSCEIDPGAIAVQQHNHYGKIVELGCVKELTPHCLHLMGRIDLLIGGSPCEDISLANTTNRRGIHDKNSTGWLVFEYQRILKFLQDRRPSDEAPLLWLYENVYPMEHEVLNSINKALECEPVKICASAFVPMRRRRHFWGNMPHMEEGKYLTKTKLVLQDFLKPFRNANVKQLPTLTTTSHSQLSGPSKKFPVIEKGVAGYLHLFEIELLFGFPMQYTAASNLSFTKRRQLLGKAWCVPVIEFIFKPLIGYFKGCHG